MSQRFKATLNRLIENTAKTNPGRRSRRNPPPPTVRGIQFDSMAEARMYISGVFDENTSFGQSAEFQGIAFEKPVDLQKWENGTIQGELAGSAIFANEMFLTFDELRAAHEGYVAPPAASAAPTAPPQSSVGGFSAPTRQPTFPAESPVFPAQPTRSFETSIPGAYTRKETVPRSQVFPSMGRSAGPRQRSPEEIISSTPSDKPISQSQLFFVWLLIGEELLNQCTVLGQASKSIRPFGDRPVGASADKEFLADIFFRYGINKQSFSRFVENCKAPTFTIEPGVRTYLTSGKGQLTEIQFPTLQIPLLAINPNRLKVVGKQSFYVDPDGTQISLDKLKTEEAYTAVVFSDEDTTWKARYHALELLRQVGFTGCTGFAADPRDLQRRRRRSQGDFANNNPSYMIPLQFPTERYIYAPDANYAHWTSSPVWSQAEFVRNNPRKMPVPDYIEKTKRSAATKISAIGKKGHWPIGDLYHARLAMIYIMSPSHQKVREKVIRAVKKHYPSYDWDGFLEEREIREDYQAAANPNDRMFTISRGNPKKYVATRMNPQGTPIPMPTNAGPYLPDMFPYGIGGRPAALQNPKRKK